MYNLGINRLRQLSLFYLGRSRCKTKPDSWKRKKEVQILRWAKIAKSMNNGRKGEAKMQIFLYQYAKSNRDWLHLEGNREQLGNAKQGCISCSNPEFLQVGRWTEVMHAQPLAVCRQRREGTLESEAESAPESAGALPGFGKIPCVCRLFFFKAVKLRDSDFPQATKLCVCSFYIRACFYLLT